MFNTSATISLLYRTASLKRTTCRYIDRHMVLQPVMGTAFQCEGVTDATVTLGPRKVSSSFYVVRG